MSAKLMKGKHTKMEQLSSNRVYIYFGIDMCTRNSDMYELSMNTVVVELALQVFRILANCYCSFTFAVVEKWSNIIPVAQAMCIHLLEIA